MTSTINLEDIKARHAALSRTTKRRNTAEYVTGGMAAAFLLVISVVTFLAADTSAEWIMAVGFAALVLGLLLVGLNIFRKSTRAGFDLATSGMGHLQQRLAHERDLLRSAWLWYIGPMVPGFVMIYLGSWATNPARPTFALVGGGSTLAVIALVIILNRRAARRIETEIRALQE
ncbi:hypothetical protein GCM10007881_23390 [Mesorhizobium huakuii]|uniref:Uncharacterized protein n=1 Tax=Mesorhizobium huakuii TaxID=28104 RepID=A0ABZ0VSE9_9HYPH|nr:hypothetical protein [Mesorhizobium huakuii]WQC00312.1 hypothetical protein U0R22_004514 [Mesorhizobium huakuii]GLQ78823.1 hypothetical protein GCM10007881_23390 [Mesorhizobium huakuii]